eukprot:s4434_g4.t3
MQAAHILLKLHRIPQSKIHLLLDINHKAIEDMEKKICKLRQEYVEKKEKEIDIEADEATFDRRDISQDVELKHLIQSKDCVMMWEQCAGIIQRGRPETLVLCKLQPKITELVDRFELPTAGVAGAVAFLMHFGMQGAAYQDASAMMQHYPASGTSPAIEQRVQGDYARPPLDFNGVRQQLSTTDFSAPGPGQSYPYYAEQPSVEKYAEQVPTQDLSAQKQLTSPQAEASPQPTPARQAVTKRQHLSYAEVHRELTAETTKLRVSADMLASLEADLQSAKVQSDLKEAAAISESFQSSQAGNALHDLILVAFGALMGAAGLCLQRATGSEFPEAPPMAAGAAGLVFSAAVWSSASPALSFAPLNPETVSSTMPQSEPAPSERPHRAAVPRPQPTSFSTRVPTISARPTLLVRTNPPASAPVEQKVDREPLRVSATMLRPQQPVPIPRSPQLAASRSALTRLSPPRGAALAPGAGRVGLTLWPQNQRRSSRPELGEY